MDSEKDKPVVEKSMSFSKKADDDTTTTDNNENVSANENKDEKSDHSDKEDSPKKEQDTSPKADDHVPDTESKPDDDKKDDEKDETIKEGEIKEGEPTEQKPESPRLPPDLNKVSEEIDEYIATLSKEKEKEPSTPPPDVPICVEQFAVLVEAKIEEYDSRDNPVKFTQLTDEDATCLLESVHRVSSLSKALLGFSMEYKYAYSINCVGAVLHRAMSYLEEEFRSLIEDHKIEDLKAKDKQVESSDSNQESDEKVDPPPESAAPVEENYFSGYTEENLSHLNKLAKMLILGGYEEECCHVYFLARRNALEESLNKLGFHKYSIDDVQKMAWDTLEREIESWIRTFKYCVNNLFPSGRKLSDAVFSQHPDISKDLFVRLSKGLTIQLLNFGRAVMLTKRAPEKLFKLLDVYEALRDIPLELGKSFPDEDWVHEVKTEGSMIRCGLGEAMISIVIELEHAIKSDSSGKTPVPGGAVHPLTKYIMNYLTYACEYRDTLEQVFRDHQKIDRADSAGGSEYDYNSQAAQQENANNQAGTRHTSPFQSQVSKVMDLLDAYLDGKSKLYKDISLSSIFLMNNGRYILQKIKGCSEIHSLMGDTWYRKRSSEIRTYHKGYQRETWGKLLNCLHPEGLLVNGKIVKPQVKERFNNFNKLFDEIHKAQSTWVVGDEQLQSELRVSISNMVIPAYRSFLGRFGQVFTPGRQTEKYVKYQAEEIETYIDELFDGNAATPVGRRKM